MENETNKKEITAKKLADGKVVTQISGGGDDIMYMLTMLQRSVAMIMLENGTPLPVVGITLLRSMEMGMDLAMKDRSGK